jgi:YrbI family 3-deoxy-D-manno-octulosonate 8-phosphate phosphatase
MIEIRLILFDVDGVLTDGTAAYNEKGEVISKSYNQKDITAMRRFQNELGINTALFSGSLDINPAFAERRKFDFISVKHRFGENKASKLNDICFDYNTPKSQVAFVGDDVQDMDIMKEVGYAFSPQDAIPEVQKISCVLPVNGGCGVAAHLFEYINNSTN